MKNNKLASILGVVVAVAALGGCAQVPENAGSDPQDPWEAMNRQIFAFNQGFDTVVSRPLAKGYQFITPEPVRASVTRVFQNTMEPANAVNNVLQGKVEDGILSLFRLLINSTVGIAGIFDVASEVDIPRKEEDVGQTLAVWGIPNGPYFVIPFLGPSTVRDGIALVPELTLDPNFYVHEPWVKWPWWGAKYINARERLLPVTDMLDNTVDPYVATRNAYFQFRQAAIQDGDDPALITAKDSNLMNPFDYDEDDSDDKASAKGKESK